MCEIIQFLHYLHNILYWNWSNHFWNHPAPYGPPVSLEWAQITYDQGRIGRVQVSAFSGLGKSSKPRHTRRSSSPVTLYRGTDSSYPKKTAL